MKILSNESSDRLTWIRFPLIAAVVYMHGLEFISRSEEILQAGPIGTNVLKICTTTLDGVVVPLFFFMSGYLFFLNFKWSWSNYLAKVRTRLKTLFIPFLFWNLLWICLISIAQNLPLTEQYLQGGIPDIVRSGVYTFFNLLLGIDRYPIAFQFWFVRDLMVLVALVPLFHILHKKFTGVSLVILFGLWYSGIRSDFMVYSMSPSLLPVCFFFAGSILAVKNKTPFILDKYGRFMILAMIILTIINIVYRDYSFIPFVDKIRTLVGIFSSLYLTRFVFPHAKLKKSLLWLAGVSFFVYAFHEPVLEVTQRLILSVWIPANDFILILFSFLLPLIIIGISIGVYVLLNRALPRFAALVTGGRFVARLPKV